MARRAALDTFPTVTERVIGLYDEHNRFRIWLHLGICNRCARLAEQLAFIRNAENISTTPFPESAKERIKERIRQWRGAGRH